ncbi:MAG: methyltransferase domain-containing protein [Pyrinomonadaceae bacterium]|nr:methyltransferase domain-containing protein [Pyrinomonadaceae bacterium]
MDKKPGWFSRKKKQRGIRALQRQLDYQENKARGVKGREQAMLVQLTARSVALQNRLNNIRPIEKSDKVLEVGSGAHGLVFGFKNNVAVGIDPLAVEYRRLFPIWQKDATTASALGEKLPFSNAAFEFVLSDNVIDHAEDPFGIIDEFARVLKPGGLLYFTVNVHHPIYQIASILHGAWNSLGLKFEISPFADHTVHLTENRVLKAFDRLPFEIIEQSSTIDTVKKNYRRISPRGIQLLVKKTFYKNALTEIIAFRD